MKKVFILCVFVSFFLLTSKLFAQSLPSGAAANFGIDGDLKSNYHLVGSWNAAGTHDWFTNSNTTAIGVIDTTGSAVATSHLITGENFVFDRGMSVPRYSVQDGYLVLDARYGRDYFAFAGSGPTSDLTTFSAGQKNGTNPANWITSPSGGAVADKADIIDAFVHMRRNGSVLSGASPSHLIAMMGASTVSNNGNRFFDVEFFCTSLSYNSTTGIFSNSGPALTGGHTAWNFNPDGSVQQFGDMSIAFSLTASDVNEIAIWIWVSSANFSTLNPAGFDFVPAEFNGAAPGAAYGYAKIQPNPGNSIAAWGGVNTSIANGPAWGTTSKSLGSSSNNYNFANYDIAQFGEAAIDLTVLGIDPYLLSGNNACNPPFKRLLFKSRSSSSFTSALQDFAGPYQFLDAPTASAAVVSPLVLNCQTPAVTLQPQSIQSGNYYHWSTTNGNMLTNPDSMYMTVNKQGKYYLQSSVYYGCTTTIDSVIVSTDSLQPVATASISGLLNNPSSTAVLYGGDPVASNILTPFGSSLGLTYSWTGPLGFTSSLRNPIVSQEGDYVLIITETRNGCKDTATTTLLRGGVPLAVKLISFKGNLNNNKISLNWTVAENEITDKFIVERSFDGINFTTVAKVPGSGKTEVENYMYNETSTSTGNVFYLLKMYEKSQIITYSKTLLFQTKENNSKEIKFLNNPVTDKLTFNFQSDVNQKAAVTVRDMTGRVQVKQNITAYQGSNLISLPLTASFSKGIYVVELSTGSERFIGKFIKQ
jgi:hypothetical protein